MLRLLLRIWRILPLWVHILGARIVRPRFRVAVAAMVFDENGCILLFKHTYRKFEWGIPAGSLEHREDPRDAVVREFREETGMQIEVERLLTAVSAREDQHVSLIYLCKIVSGEFAPTLEISEINYFNVNDLPPMLFTEKDLIRRVADMVQKGKTQD
ncbi:MAG: NUDIX domain-containing protein [Chloroflexota bacterium]